MAFLSPAFFVILLDSVHFSCVHSYPDGRTGGFPCMCSVSCSPELVEVVTVKIREKGGPWMLADTSTDPATLVHKGGKAVPGHLTYVRVRGRELVF